MRVNRLLLYPLKSGAGVEVPRLNFDARGPIGDRRWLLVDASTAVALTQRDLPMMSQLEVALVDLAASRVEIRDRRAPTLPSLQVDARDGLSRASVRVWSTKIEALDAGDAAAAWLSERLGRACRLVFQDEAATRAIWRHPERQVSFADAYPLLVVSQAALDELERRFGGAVTALRFRPNMVIEGCEAHAEDRWKRIRIGTTEIELAGPCERCTVPSIDPTTGQESAGFNRALASYRRVREVIVFGQNALHVGNGPISVGDHVEVIEAA